MRARGSRRSRRAFPNAVDRDRDGRGAGRGRGRAALAGERAHRGRRAAEDSAAPRALPELTPERVEALVAEANDAMLAENYDRSIQIYTRLLEEPGFGGRREARERLGIARERKGQLAQARHEYDAYLAEFPDGADAERVRQRLAGLVAAAAPARERVETGDGRGVDLGLRRRRRTVLSARRLPAARRAAGRDAAVRVRVEREPRRAAARRAIRARVARRRAVSLQPDRRGRCAAPRGAIPPISCTSRTLT